MPPVWVGLVMVALFASTALLGRPDGYPDTGAAAWLPPDGTRQRFAGPGGTIATEWALDQAAPLLISGPPQFQSWMARTELNWETASLARQTGVFESPTGEVLGRADDLYSVAVDGVRVEVEAPSPGTTRIYLPGRLDVPADLGGGASWSSTGMVIEMPGQDEELPYRADFTARTPEDRSLILRGCVVVGMRLQLGSRAPTTTDTTWCRRAGVIAVRADAGTWVDTGTVPAAEAQADPGFDWSRAEDLTFTPRTVNQIGVGTTLLSPVGPPGLLPDGSIVTSNRVTTHDVLALDTAADPPPVSWRARPGGHNTAAATLGSTTVAAGSDRRLVAYGPSGQWLWQQQLSDLAVVPPARLGDLVVVPTLDGQVAAYDLATGARRWSYTSSAEIRVAPVATSDRVLVVDQAGQLTCLDQGGNEVWAIDAGRVSTFAVWAGRSDTRSAGPLVIVPQGDGMHVQALSLADGSRLWRVREYATVRDLVALDRLVVLRDADEVVAMDPLTGTRLWSWTAARTWAGAGGADRLLLLAADRLVLLDDRGQLVREWPVSVGDVSAATPYLVAAQRRLLVYGPGGVALGVLP